MKKVFAGIPKSLSILIVLTTITFSLLNALFTKYTTSIVDRTFDNSILKVALLITIFIIGWNLIEFAGDMLMRLSHIYVENEVFKQYINKLYYIKPSVLKSYNTGYITGIIQKLVSRQYNTYKCLFEGAVLDLTYVIYCAVILLPISGIYSILLIVMLSMVTYCRILIMMKLNKHNALLMSEADGNRSKLFIDISTNINTVQKMCAIDYMNDKMCDMGVDCKKKTLRFDTLDEVAFMLAKFIAYLFTPASILLTWYLLSNGIEIEVVTIAFIMGICIQVPHNVRSISRAVSNFDRFRSSIDRIEEIICEENKRKDLYTDSFETVEIKCCSYSYVDKDTHESMHIIIPNFAVNKGDFVCISGESGQGKTTLLHILSNEIETDKVFIDGVSTDKRLDCVFIAQDTEMFDMTVRENLTLGRNISDDILLEFLEEVGMGDWIRSQENGLDTILGERGVFVSTGQRQRLNLIRGLLIQDKEIYLLDEPTSNVDEETEKKIIALIQRVLKDKTVIIVTHRYPIKKICNRNYHFVNSYLYEESVVTVEHKKN